LSTSWYVKAVATVAHPCEPSGDRGPVLARLSSERPAFTGASSQ